jgi:hypothetical protein
MFPHKRAVNLRRSLPQNPLLLLISFPREGRRGRKRNEEILNSSLKGIEQKKSIPSLGLAV